jgi:hypothetical protein
MWNAVAVNVDTQYRIFSLFLEDLPISGYDILFKFQTLLGDIEINATFSANTETRS